MKAFFKVLGVLAYAALAIVGCNKPVEEEPVKIRLNKELITDLPAGSTQTLVATLIPADAQVTVVWASDDETIAVVNEEGMVTGVAPGTAMISATVDKEVATCKVQVTSVKPTKVALNPADLKLVVDTQHVLEVVVTPSNAHVNEMEWASNNNKVAMVDITGRVTALAEGEAVITVKCKGSNTLAAACHVKVVAEDTPEEPKPEDPDPDDPDPDDPDPDDPDPDDPKPEETVKSVVIYSENNVQDLQVGKPLQLYATYEPSTARPNSVSWTVDNTDYAQIDQNGVLTGTYTVKGSDGNWPKVTVTVTADDVSSSMSLRVIPAQPDYIEVDLPENNQLRVGHEWYFNPRVIPEGLGYKVYCSSSMPNGSPQNDPYSAYVSDVPGTITVTFAVSNHADLVYSTYRRDVYVDVIPYWVETISLPQTQEMEIGTSMTFTPAFTSDVPGVQPTYTDVKWTSSDPAVASVNEKTGEITPHTAGTTTITATTDNYWSVPNGTEPKSASCRLTVKEASSDLNIGDYYYSDGTWSSDLDASKTVIGVVFAKVNATTSDTALAKDYPGCTRGLVLSTVEYSAMLGDFSNQYAAEWLKANGHSAVSNTDIVNGYYNSMALAAYRQSKGGNYALFFDAESGVAAQHNAAVAAPSLASAWYIPSYKEMRLMYESMSVLNEAINAASGTPLTAETAYSLSTFQESGKYGDYFEYGFDMSSGGWSTYMNSKTQEYPVRVVLAF